MTRDTDIFISSSMPNDIKSPSVTIQNNSEPLYNSHRCIKRKLHPDGTTCPSIPHTSTEDQNKEVSLPAEEEQAESKKNSVIFECVDMKAFTQKFCKKHADVNLFVVQQEEHIKAKNMRGKDARFYAVEQNGAASSSETAAAKPIKIHERGTPLLSDSILNERQNHVASVPSSLPLRRANILAGKLFSQRGRNGETLRVVVKSGNTMDGGHTSAFGTMKLIPKNDEYDNIGYNIAAKLRRLPFEQSIIAEKLIHQVVYEAALGSLKRSTRIITPSPAVNNWGNIPFPAANNSFNELNMYSHYYESNHQ